MNMSMIWIKTRCVILAGILLLASLPALFAKEKTGSPKTMFRERVIRIEKRVVDLTAPSDLFRSEDFIQVYEKPKDHVKEALELLASPDAGETGKLIAAYSMQKLPRPDYLKFLDATLALWKAGRVSVDVYWTAAFPTLEWNTTLQENYKDPAVAAFLKKARAAAKSEANKKYIDRILSGVAAQDVEDMRDTGTIGPKAP